MAHIAIDARLISSTTGRYIERLLHYLETIDTENEYTVLVRDKDETYWTPTSDNFQVKVAEFADFSFDEQIGFKRLLDNLKPDLVHFCLPEQPILYTGKTVTTFHDLTLLNTYNPDKNWFVYHAKQFVGRFVFKRVASKSRVVLVPTVYTKQALIKATGVDESKVRVTYESAEPPTGSPRPYDVPFKRFIMYIGQQSEYKNIRRLILAHQTLLSADPELGLVLVGKKNAPIMANEKWVLSKGLKNVHFTGFIPDEQRDWLLDRCDAYVFPSLMEGFGLPGLEAMAAGAPVVSSNATCLPEVYGDAAEYFDPNDTDDMTRAIGRVIDDKKLREKLITAGHKQIKKYSWRRMAEQTHQAYLDALK